MKRVPFFVCAGLGVLLATAGSAQTPQQPLPPQQQPQSPRLEPLPEIPPPQGAADADLEPQVTVTQRNGEKIEETRINGALVWIKVTPRNGIPYYLIPTGQGANTFLRANSLDTALSVPMWQLFTW
jgi:hypothetical protein